MTSNILHCYTYRWLLRQRYIRGWRRVSWRAPSCTCCSTRRRAGRRPLAATPPACGTPGGRGCGSPDTQSAGYPAARSGHCTHSSVHMCMYDHCSLCELRSHDALYGKLLHAPADNTREVGQVERHAVGTLVVDVIVVDVGVAVEQHGRVLRVAGVIDDDSSRFLSTASSDCGTCV